ncbi:MAG: hypothetical protein AVDCRST_MAG68-2184, partial [uncultured Gemmatimonadetes bacterium]
EEDHSGGRAAGRRHPGRERAGAGVRRLPHRGPGLLAGRPDRLSGRWRRVRRGGFPQRGGSALGVRRVERPFGGWSRRRRRGPVLRRDRAGDAHAGRRAGTAGFRLPAGALRVHRPGRQLHHRHPGGPGDRRHLCHLARGAHRVALRDPAGGLPALRQRRRRRRFGDAVRPARRGAPDLWDVLFWRRGQLPGRQRRGHHARPARRRALL